MFLLQGRAGHVHAGAPEALAAGVWDASGQTIYKRHKTNGIRNRARYLNASSGRFWTMDASEGASDSPPPHKYLYAGGDKLTDRGQGFKRKISRRRFRMTEAGQSVSH